MHSQFETDSPTYSKYNSWLLVTHISGSAPNLHLDIYGVRDSRAADTIPTLIDAPKADPAALPSVFKN